MTDRSEWVTVVPAEGELVATAQALLAVADPRDVLTIGNGVEFLVPPEVADAYHAQQAAPSATPKRRGRAPKLNETEG